jgi:DNA-binding response OmpR family regulator
MPQTVYVPRRVQALLDYLEAHQGLVVPYSTLSSIVGRESLSREALHVYMTVAKKALAARRAPYVIAVAHGAGYALCRLAPRVDRSRLRFQFSRK